MKSRTVTLLTVASVIGAGSVAAFVNSTVLGTDFDPHTPLPMLVPVAPSPGVGTDDLMDPGSLDDPTVATTAPIEVTVTTAVMTDPTVVIAATTTTGLATGTSPTSPVRPLPIPTDAAGHVSPAVPSPSSTLVVASLPGGVPGSTAAGPAAPPTSASAATSPPTATSVLTSSATPTVTTTATPTVTTLAAATTTTTRPPRSTPTTTRPSTTVASHDDGPADDEPPAHDRSKDDD